jgi:hypothetical protein
MWLPLGQPQARGTKGLPHFAVLDIAKRFFVNIPVGSRKQRC